jgi:hypothetical protein
MRHGNLGRFCTTALNLTVLSGIAFLVAAGAALAWDSVAEGRDFFGSFTVLFAAFWLIGVYFRDLREDRWRFEAVKDMTAAIVATEGGDATEVAAKAVALGDLVCRGWTITADDAMEFLHEPHDV